MTLKQSEAGWGVLTQSWRATEKLVIIPTQNSDVGGQRKNHSHYVCSKNSTEILFDILPHRLTTLQFSSELHTAERR